MSEVYAAFVIGAGAGALVATVVTLYAVATCLPRRWIRTS